jgi:hypothetical protein
VGSHWKEIFTDVSYLANSKQLLPEEAAKMNLEKNAIAKYAPIGTLIIVFASAMCGMTAYITGSMHNVENRISARLECLEKDVAIIKTVMLMKGIMPAELATNENK